MGALLSESLKSWGRAFSRQAFRAASTGSRPEKGGSCSNSSNKIMAQEYTSTCRA